MILLVLEQLRGAGDVRHCNMLIKNGYCETGFIIPMAYSDGRYVFFRCEYNGTVIF